MRKSLASIARPVLERSDAAEKTRTRTLVRFVIPPMSYTALARRYRSETFDQVVGQEAITATLKNALATGRIAHAYLFTGTRGVGKTTMARLLAKALNCLQANGPTINPCLKCESCQSIAEGNDIDVIEIDAASNTGVDHIRELRQNAIYRPARARFKIYIIDEVHMLSTSAFNALLKTLEEPPEHVKFIMATTEVNKILPTILSRCQRFDFRHIRPEDIARQVEHVLKEEGASAEEPAIRRIARLARGSMRDALSLLDQLLSVADGTITLDLLNEMVGRQRSDQIVDLADAITAGDPAGALEGVDRCLGEGVDPEHLARGLLEHFRDLLMLCSCGPQTTLVELDDPNLREKAARQAERLDPNTLVYCITVAEEVRRAVKSAGAGRPFLEAAVVRLSCMDQFQDANALVQQTETGRAISMPQARPAPTGSPAQKKSTPAAPEAEPVAPATQLAIPESPDLTFLQEHWTELLTELGRANAQHLHYLFRSARPVAWDPPTLTLRFQQLGMYNLVSSNKGKLEEFNQALGRIIKTDLHCLLTVAEQTESDTAAATSSPGAKLSQSEMRQAMLDPGVKQIQEVLGGKVKKVTRLQT